MPSSVPMLRLKRHPFEDIFETAKRDARIRQQRDEERRRERERLERDEGEKPAIVPVVQHLNRQVLPWAVPLQQPARYKGASGGRGSGKSHFFAEEAVEAMVKNPSLRFACIREVQKSLKLSVKSVVESKIRSLGVTHLFDITTTEIRRVDGDGLMIFMGMQDHTAESIKSLEGFGIAWVEEAHMISQKSLDLLLPTIRMPHSEVWFSWNETDTTDPVDVFFKKRNPADPSFVHVRATFKENHFADDVLRHEAARKLANDPEAYEHIWEGGYFLGGKGRVYANFKNKPYPDGNIDESIVDDGSELLVGMDFNVNPMTCVVAIRAVDECLVLAALEIPTSNTATMANAIKELYPDRHIVVCPDPAGRQRRSSTTIVGQTDFTILERAGFEIRAPNTHPAVVDRENNANQMYLEDGRRRVRIHPDADALTQALSGLTYNEATGRRNERSRFVHICDAMDYLLWQEFPVLEEQGRQWGSSTTGLY